MSDLELRVNGKNLKELKVDELKKELKEGDYDGK